MYVYCYNDGSRRNLRRPIVQEYVVAQLVLAYLLREEADLAHLVVVQNAEIPLNKVNGSLKVKVKAEAHQDVALKLFQIVKRRHLLL